jgi:hypothetical protein
MEESKAEQDKTLLANQMLSEARGDAVQADQKASILLAILGISFSVIISGQFSNSFDVTQLSFWSQRLWWFAMILSFSSLLLAVSAVWPRFKLKNRTDDTIAYWGHIAQHKKLTDFTTSFENISISDRDRVLHQLWSLSRIVRSKYRLVRYSLLTVSIGTVLLFLAERNFL